MVSKPELRPEPARRARHRRRSTRRYDALDADPADPLHQPRDRRRPQPARVDVQARRRRRRRSRAGDYTPDSRRSRTRRRYTLPRSPHRRSTTPSGGTCGGGDTRDDRRRAAALAATSRWPSSAVELGDDAIREQAEKFGFDEQLRHAAARRRRAATRAALDDRRPRSPAFGQGQVTRDAAADGDGLGRRSPTAAVVMNPTLVDRVIGARPVGACRRSSRASSARR